MPYTINTFNREQLVILEDGTVDTETTDIKLVGKMYPGYGEIQNENFIYILENFADINPPEKPLTGQIWYDTTEDYNKLKFFDGSRFKSLSVVDSGDVEPENPAIGDMWWDTYRNQLFMYMGVEGQDPTNYELIGPQAAGPNMTQMRSKLVVDSEDNYNFIPIIVSIVDGQDLFTISSQKFTVDNTVEDTYKHLNNIDLVQRGITFTYDDSENADNPFIDISSIIIRDGIYANDGDEIIGTVELPFDASHFNTVNIHDSILAVDGDETIGTVEIPFDTAYINNISLSSLNVSDGIYATESDVKIGTTTNPFNELYINDVYITSDIKKKTNIEDIDNALDKINSLRGVTFEWKHNNKKSIGLIAQEVEKIIPEVVEGDSDKSVSYSNLVSLLIEGIKELHQEIQQLKKER